MTSTYQLSIESAIAGGQWDVVYDDATSWSEEADCGPLPFFALNVVCLLRGDFAQAWRVYPQALGDEAHVQLVREWVGVLRERYPDSPDLALFEGIFHTQSGLLDDAFACFERVVVLAPQSPYPHFFLAQIHQRQGVWIKRSNHSEKRLSEIRLMLPLGSSLVWFIKNKVTLRWRFLSIEKS